MGVLKELKLKDFVTLTGTFCGVTSIFFSVFMQAFRAAGGFLFLGVIMDLLDGFVARKTNQINDLGKELDSLSDSLVFGVAPGLLAGAYFSQDSLNSGVSGISWAYLLVPVFIFIIGAILRLAWFNIDEGEGYTGLVTPISAGSVVLYTYVDYYWSFIPGVGDLLSKIMLIGVIPFLIMIAYFNVSPYLIYGAHIRKKGGILKYIFPIIGFMGLAILPLGYDVDKLPTTSIYIIIILGVMWALLIYYIAYGFYGYKKEQEQSEQA